MSSVNVLRSFLPHIWRSSLAFRPLLSRRFAAVQPYPSPPMAAQLEPLPEVARLSPACIRILGGNPGRFFLQGTNTYLVGTGRTRLLIDTGEGKASWSAALERTLAAEQATLAAVLLTHWHQDHVGGVEQARALAPALPVYQSRLAMEHAYEDIVDGQRFQVEGATLRAVHTPGHTADHMVFVLEEEGALFAGDNVLGQGTAVFEELGVYLRSLEQMLQVSASASPPSLPSGIPGRRRLYPGHGPVIEDGLAKIAEYIAHRQQREDQVLRLLLATDKQEAGAAVTNKDSPSGARAQTAMDLVEVIYADVRRDLFPAAERGIVQILQKLEDEGRVERNGIHWTVR